MHIFPPPLDTYKTTKCKVIKNSKLIDIRVQTPLLLRSIIRFSSIKIKRTEIPIETSVSPFNVNLQAGS
jgi:hypothetical protein